MTSRKISDRKEHTGTDDVLVCLSCSEAFQYEQFEGKNCHCSDIEEEKVLSIIQEDNNEGQILTSHKINELADAITTTSIREATKNVLDGHKARFDVFTELFDVRHEVWLPLVAECIDGRCLDMYTGYGRRAMRLSELADSVYAVDPSLAKVRIVAGRDDYNTENVTAIHTDVDRLPFHHECFDTIIADFTNKGDIESQINKLRKYLEEDGSLIFLADGWPRRTNLTALTGIEQASGNNRGSLTPSTTRGYESLAKSSGFEHVSIYTLFPAASRPLYSFNVESDHAVQNISSYLANHYGYMGRVGKRVLNAFDTCGILKHCYPSYVITCTNDQNPPLFDFSDPLAIPGRTRSVILDMQEGGVTDVWKIPNRNAHAAFTERENDILLELKSGTNKEIVSTLPEGQITNSTFGEVRRESPVTGSPLDETLTNDVSSFERVLRKGLDWLSEFQNEYRGRTISQSPADKFESLPSGIFEDGGFCMDLKASPEINECAKTFTTAVHGDFMPANIYQHDGTVHSVIDWEYGELSASPVIDSGFFLLNASSWIGDDFSERVSAILCSQSEYAERAQPLVRKYCDSVGLPYRTFELNLPLAYLHRISIDWRHDAVSTYTERMEERMRRTQILFDAIDNMNLS